MTDRIIWFCRARSEDAAQRLQALGWVADEDQPINHHINWSVLLRWPHEGDPPPMEP